MKPDLTRFLLLALTTGSHALAQPFTQQTFLEQIQTTRYQSVTNLATAACRPCHNQFTSPQVYHSMRKMSDPQKIVFIRNAMTHSAMPPDPILRTIYRNKLETIEKRIRDRRR